MNDTIARIAAALEELAGEVDHADILIAEQAARIDQLERQVRLLQVLLDATRRGAAA